MSKSQRLADAGMDKNKPYPKKEGVKSKTPAKAPAKKSVKSKSKVGNGTPSSAPIPSAKPSKTASTSAKPQASKPVAPFGRDRFVPEKKEAPYKPSSGMGGRIQGTFGSKPSAAPAASQRPKPRTGSYRESEIKSLSEMRRDRLGPGQR